MISRTSGTPIMEEITIMKIAGRLFSNIEFITVVELTGLAVVIVVVGGVGGPGAAVVGRSEISCKAFVALVNAAVAFSNALVVFCNVSLTISDIALPIALVALFAVNPSVGVAVAFIG